MEFRISKVQERLNYTRKDAMAYIEKKDGERRKWTQFLYGVDWRDASLYDLVLNLEQMNLGEACDVVCTVSRLGCFAMTPQTQKALDDLAKASRVKAILARNPATTDLQFKVTAQNGAVSIKGEIVSPQQVKLVSRIARTVPGVSEVRLDELELATRF